MARSGGLLPPLGVELSISARAVHVPLRMDALGVLPLEFAGRLTLRAEATLGAGLGGSLLRVVACELSADSPVLGRITLCQADRGNTRLSVLEVASEVPRRYRNTLELGLLAIIERPLGGGPPLVLTSVATAALHADDLRAFPPVGEAYRLAAPVDLALAVLRQRIVGQLAPFELTLSHEP